MDDERRRVPRARLPGVRVACEAASGRRVDGEVLDVGLGGLFVRTPDHVPVGARLSLEIQVAGEPQPWMLLGRVRWVREEDGDADRPRGFGVAFLDVEDAVAADIDRLIAAHKAVPSVRAAPPRERTVLGVGAEEAGPVAVQAAPIVSAAPARERTVLGIGLGDAQPAPAAEPTAPTEEPMAPPPEPEAPLDAREASIAIDLVTKSKPPSAPPPAMASEASLSIAGVPRHRGRVWLVLLVLAAAGAAYAFREPLRPAMSRAMSVVRSLTAP